MSTHMTSVATGSDLTLDLEAQGHHSHCTNNEVVVSLPAASLLLPGCVFGTPWGYNAALSEYRDIKAVLGGGFGSSPCFACSFLPETPRLSQELCWSLGSPPLGPPMISPTLPIPSTPPAPLTLSSLPRAASRRARRDWAVLGHPLATGVAGGCAGNGWGQVSARETPPVQRGTALT